MVGRVTVNAVLLREYNEFLDWNCYSWHGEAGNATRIVHRRSADAEYITAATFYNMLQHSNLGIRRGWQLTSC